MAKRRQDIIEGLELLILVLNAVVDILKRQQASEDMLFKKGGFENA